MRLHFYKEGSIYKIPTQIIHTFKITVYSIKYIHTHSYTHIWDIRCT
jgi:hypothetical protein